MDENEKKEMIDDAKETIDMFSTTLKVDGTKVKDHITKLNDSELKLLKELEEIIHILKKPFWKIAIYIIVASSVFNIMYLLGQLIGKIIANLGI